MSYVVHCLLSNKNVTNEIVRIHGCNNNVALNTIKNTRYFSQNRCKLLLNQYVPSESPFSLTDRRPRISILVLSLQRSLLGTESDIVLFVLHCHLLKKRHISKKPHTPSSYTLSLRLVETPNNLVAVMSEDCTSNQKKATKSKKPFLLFAHQFAVRELALEKEYVVDQVDNLTVTPCASTGKARLNHCTRMKSNLNKLM